MILEPESPLVRGDALLLVDVQRDFFPGGALEVPDSDAVVPVLNRWIEAARRGGLPVFATRDWHPVDHSSFREFGGPWPPHAVKDTEGARFHRALALPADAVVIDKGSERSRDALSAFKGTGLTGRLRDAGVRRLWIGGLSLDASVQATVMDALELGFAVCLLVAGTRARDPRRGRRRLEEMQKLGVRLVAGVP